MNDYFRRDQERNVTPPNLAKDCTFAEHIVNARGKKTKFSSVSLDLLKIRDFGEASYQLLRDKCDADGHATIEHNALITELKRVAKEGVKEERARAIQAFRYARYRKEGLVDWCFDHSMVEQKDLINWTERKVQPYFKKL